MTVRELRQKLFEIPNQEAVVLSVLTRPKDELPDCEEITQALYSSEEGLVYLDVDRTYRK